jgi:hypothetical protein
LKSFYELLGVERTAEAEKVKRAFRREIARYHPDKVQHLGPEFQEIAATRAAELTEAYRILMDPAAREAYDASLADVTPGAARPPARPADAHEPAAAPSSSAGAAAPDPSPAPVPEALKQTQATLSQFVRKATMGRLRESIDAVFGSVQPLPIDGFDAAFAVQSRKGLFQKAEPPVNLLARIVARVDADAVESAWPLAAKAGTPDRMVCLLLLGLGMAPSRELAASINDQRRRTRQVAPVVVPIDTRDWSALLPPETPSLVRKLLDRLKLGA